MIKNERGISLISLIIMIIVIIILAAIVIFNGFETTESAEFAKFAQEFSGYQEEIDQRYLTTKTQSVLDGRRKKDSAIYSEMGSPAGTVFEVLDGKVLSKELEGTLCYKLPDDRRFYEGDGGTYVTDKGEIFTMPGYSYKIYEEERRYVNSNKYYLVSGFNTPDGNSGDNSDKTNSPIDELIEMTGAPTVNGTIAVGDYVEYTPDVATYTYNEVPDGKLSGDYYLGGGTTSRTIETDTVTKWIVVKINSGSGEKGEILITPQNAVNSLSLTREPGYINSVRILNYVCGKLYSNSVLGIRARSMRLEDLNCNATGATIRYAYYANGIVGMPETITVNEKVYTCKEHVSASKCRFWEYDEETSKELIKPYTMTVNGEKYTYNYAEPTENKPVLVTVRKYSGGTQYMKVIRLIGHDYGMIASPYIELDNARVDYFLCHVGGSLRGGSGMVGSNGNVYGGSNYGIRPLVTLGSGLHLSAIDDESIPGSPENPWIITKK